MHLYTATIQEDCMVQSTSNLKPKNARTQWSAGTQLLTVHTDIVVWLGVGSANTNRGVRYAMSIFITPTQTLC